MMIGTAAVILAGGRSSRMNGKDKALLDMGGIPLVELQYRRWLGVFDETAVSIGRPGRYPFLRRACTIADEAESSGPLSGLLAAMRSIEAERYFIIAVDMPFSSPDLGRFIVSHLGEHDAALIRRNDGHLEPLFAVYSRRCLPVIEEIFCKGEKSIIHGLIPRIDAMILSEEDIPYDAGILLQSANTPEEWKNLAFPPPGLSSQD